MNELALDPGVFIRSMATRGAMGGMARAALDAVDILDVARLRHRHHRDGRRRAGRGRDRQGRRTRPSSSPRRASATRSRRSRPASSRSPTSTSSPSATGSDANRTLADLKHDAGARRSRLGAKPEWAIPVLGVSALTGEGFDELRRGASDATATARSTSELGRAGARRIAAVPAAARRPRTCCCERFARAAAAHAPDARRNAARQRAPTPIRSPRELRRRRASGRSLPMNVVRARDPLQRLRERGRRLGGERGRGASSNEAAGAPGGSSSPPAISR